MTDDGEDAYNCEFLTAAVPEDRLGFDRGRVDSSRAT